MRSARSATLAISTASVLLAGAAIVLVGVYPMPEPVEAAVRIDVVADAGREAVSPRVARAQKTDRLGVAGGLSGASLAAAATAGPLRPMGYAAEPGEAAPVFGRLIIDGTVHPEFDATLRTQVEAAAVAADNFESLDDEESAASVPLVGLVPPPVAAEAEPPLPPEKPRVPAAAVSAAGPAGGGSASRASLFATSRPQPQQAAPAQPSRFGFFAALGLGGDGGARKLAAYAPAAPATRPGVVVPTPFGVPYVLQTEQVEASCLKPQLVAILGVIERHYGHKVTLTSGARPRGREGSLHRSCQAADIIVPGVEAEALARYARTIPGIGGVGTYCHPQMIHVDIGTPRDWHFGCGGDYFAMRDGSGERRVAGRAAAALTE